MTKASRRPPRRPGRGAPRPPDLRREGKLRRTGPRNPILLAPPRWTAPSIPPGFWRTCASSGSARDRSRDSKYCPQNWRRRCQVRSTPRCSTGRQPGSRFHAGLLPQYVSLGQQVAPQHRSTGQHWVESRPQQVSSTPQRLKPQQARPAAEHSPPQHLPSRQVKPPVPAQPPQCLGSFAVSTHSPSHLALPFLHLFLVHLQVVPSRDRLPLQAGTHAPWHLTVPAGHDSHAASAAISRWRDRCPPAAQTHAPFVQA
jgi:hypothetical protein